MHHGIQRNRKTIPSHLLTCTSLANLTGPKGQVEMPHLVQGNWWTSIWVQDDLESTRQSLPGVSGRPGLQGQGNLLGFCISASFPSLHPLDHAIPADVAMIHSLELHRSVSQRNQLSGKSLWHGLLWGEEKRQLVQLKFEYHWETHVNIQGAFM